MEASPDDYLFRSEAASGEEAWRCCHVTMIHKLPATRMIDANFKYANEGLARLYWLPAIAGETPQTVSLPVESGRFGILGHSSVLTVTSHEVEKSIVIRVAKILKNIFGTLPNPPADDPPFETDSQDIRTIFESG